MILTVGLNDYEIDVTKNFTPTYLRAIKFSKSISGKVFAQDMGSEFDRYSVSIKLIGDRVDIDEIALVLASHNGQVTLDTQGLPVIGTGINYSTPFTCNYSFNKWDVEDVITGTIDLFLNITSQVVYDLTIPNTLPTLIYDFPINRNAFQGKNNFDSMAIGGSGVNFLLNIYGDPEYSQETNVKMKLTYLEFAQLHRFIASNRATPFNITTSAALNLFLNSTTTSVIITNFTYKMSTLKMWDVSITLAKNE
jgi:hypothetical protein